MILIVLFNDTWLQCGYTMFTFYYFYVPLSPDTNENAIKKIRNETTEKNVTWVYAKFNHFDNDKDATSELQAKMSNDIKILGSKTLQPNGYLAKVYDKDLRRIFQEKLHFKPTANTLNKKAFCINKIDETIDISELETTIEKALDEK